MFLFALVFFFLFFLFIDYFFEAIYPFAVRSGVNRAHTVRIAVTSFCSLASAMRNALPIWVYTCVTEISLDFFFYSSLYFFLFFLTCHRFIIVFFGANHAEHFTTHLYILLRLCILLFFFPRSLFIFIFVV